MVYKFFDKKHTGSGVNFVQNQQLANELHEPIIRKFLKSWVYCSLKEYFRCRFSWYQLISKYNKEIRYFLCAIDIFSKYAWVVPVKDKKGVLLLISKYFKSKSILKTAQNENQTKYGLIKAANFITAFSKNG